METAKATVGAEKLIQRTLNYLTRRVRVERVILFGSHARGAADRWSDIDLAVVSADFARMTHEQVMDLLVEVALAVDPVVEVRPYTPHELEQARPTNFLGHILATGAVVYQAGKTHDGGRRSRVAPAGRRGGAVAGRKRQNDRAR